MTPEELAEFRRRLSMLSDSGIEGVYNTAYKDCRLEGKRIPPAAAIQQIVAAWKELRNMQRSK